MADPIKQSENPDFFPYDANVEDKGYNNAQPILKNLPENFEIPESGTKRQVVDIMGESTKKETTNTEQRVHSNVETKPTEKQHQPVENPYIQPQNTSDPVRRKNAKRLASMALNAYAQLKTFSYMAMSLDEAKLQRRSLKGNFDMDALSFVIELGPNDHITVLQFIEDYNTSLKRNFQIEEDGRCHLDEAFYSEMLSDLTEFFYKKGYGANIETNMLYRGGMDLIETFVGAIGLRASVNQVLKSVSEMMQNKNAIPQNIENNIQTKQEEPILMNHPVDTPPEPIKPAEQKNDSRPFNTVDQAQANVYGTEKNPVENISSMPTHSVRQIAPISPLKRGRKPGSKDTVKRNNKNYFTSNAGKNTKHNRSAKSNNKNKSEKKINNKSHDELLEFDLPKNRVDQLNEA